MKIKTGDKDVLETGSVISFGKEPVEFTLNDPLSGDMVLRLVFVDDQSKTIFEVQTELINQTTLEFRLINFNVITGIGNAEPISLGTLAGRRLFFNYRVYSLNNSDMKTIHYTFYLGEVVNG